MKLAAVWSPDASRGVACAVVDGNLVPVGDRDAYADVSELLVRWGGAVDAAAFSEESLGHYDDLATAEPNPRAWHLLAPVSPAEVWAAGVTYERSRDARMYESDERDIYERVYDAPRPELFLKATAARVVGPGAPVGLRSDSEWQIPEPEIGLVLGSDGEVLGYTLGNDMSSRDIEGDNPLYLPQAKIFAGSCALGPCVVTAAAVEDPYALRIDMRVVRGGRVVVEGSTTTARLHKRFETLTDHLRRDNWIAPGTVLLTGTGIVPPDNFTLAADDIVEIACEPIGTLRNRCRPAAELPPPAGWTR